jgi:predicted nucleic acid-binding protein
VSLDPGLAIDAARTSLETGLPMADSIMLATARAHGATLWTQDEHFADLPGVRYVRRR